MIDDIVTVFIVMLMVILTLAGLGTGVAWGNKTIQRDAVQRGYGLWDFDGEFKWKKDTK